MVTAGVAFVDMPAEYVATFEDAFVEATATSLAQASVLSVDDARRRARRELRGLKAASRSLRRAAVLDAVVCGGAWAADYPVAPGLAWGIFLYVEDDYRRSGMGRLLVEDLEHQCVEAGFVGMAFTVYADNSAAIPLYEGLGYQAASLSMQKFFAGTGGERPKRPAAE